jgi:hypothetical protein
VTGDGAAAVPDAADYDGSEDYEALSQLGWGAKASGGGADLPAKLARYEPLEGTGVVMGDGRVWVIAPLTLAQSDPIFEREESGAVRIRRCAAEPHHRDLAERVDRFVSGAPASKDAEAWAAYLAATTDERLMIQLLALMVNYDVDLATVNREQIVKVHTFNRVLSALLGISGKKAAGAGSS